MKKKKNNIFAKVLVWIMLIAMVGSLIASLLVYFF